MATHLWFLAPNVAKSRWRAWASCHQACSQVVRFAGAKYIFRDQHFCFYYMVNTNFSGHNKIWGTKKTWGTAPECSPVATGLVTTITINLFVNLGTVTVLYTISLLYQQSIQLLTRAPEARGSGIGFLTPW